MIWAEALSLRQISGLSLSSVAIWVEVTVGPHAQVGSVGQVLGQKPVSVPGVAAYLGMRIPCPQASQRPEAAAERFHGGVGLLYADLVSATYRQTILQTYVPDRMRGRLQGVYTVVVAGGPSLGNLRAGAMAAATTLTIAWSGAALAGVVVVAVAALAVRPFWRYDVSRV